MNTSRNRHPLLPQPLVVFWPWKLKCFQIYSQILWFPLSLLIPSHYAADGFFRYGTIILHIKQIQHKWKIMQVLWLLHFLLVSTSSVFCVYCLLIRTARDWHRGQEVYLHMSHSSSFLVEPSSQVLNKVRMHPFIPCSKLLWSYTLNLFSSRVRVLPLNFVETG